MSKVLFTGFVLVFASLAVGCEEPAANKFCKGPDGTAQDCTIACKTTKKDDVCKLAKTKIEALCDKAGKKACQEICDNAGKEKDENACAYVKTMK